jgi:hypothetical protein
MSDQPDSLDKRDSQLCRCGSCDGKRVAFAFLRSFLVSSMVREEEFVRVVSAYTSGVRVDY